MPSTLAVWHASWHICLPAACLPRDVSHAGCRPWLHLPAEPHSTGPPPPPFAPASGAQKNFNYAVVMLCGTIILAMIAWFVSARKWFKVCALGVVVVCEGQDVTMRVR